MKALRFREVGDLGKLQIEEMAVPESGPGEVLVQVKAFAINPSDIKNVLGNMVGLTTLPRIPGRDFAGVVTKGGKWQGLEVFGSAQIGFDRDGVQAEYVVVPEDALVQKPKELSFEVCASFGIPYMTAWTTIVDQGGVKKGDDVLITGVNGAVGSVAAQIAKYKGARVFGAARAPARVLHGAAIDRLIDLEKEDLAQVILQETLNKGVEISLDTVGGSLLSACLKSLATAGRHIAISTTEPEVSFNLLDFYRRDQSLLGINSLRFINSQTAAILQNVLSLVNEGALQAPQPKVFSFDQALQVYQQIHAGTLKGKIAITMEGV